MVYLYSEYESLSFVCGEAYERNVVLPALVATSTAADSLGVSPESVCRETPASFTKHRKTHGSPCTRGEPRNCRPALVP